MTVALIAQEFLTPTAKQRLELMLASDNDPLTGKDVASRATWADRYCDSDRNTTKVRYNATQNSLGHVANKDHQGWRLARWVDRRKRT